MMEADDELDAIYSEFDEMARCGHFSMIDATLRGIDVDNSPSDVILLGYLTASLPMKSRLRSRGEFFLKCWATLVGRHGTFQAALMLKGLW